jgi:poly [ADP-ribose] polymerase 2/3/4
VPHVFGRQRPPSIDNLEMLKEKFDLVGLLGDIEIAQGLKKIYLYVNTHRH